MERVAELLKGVFYFATTDGDQPRVRTFDSCVEFNGDYYFETSREKYVYEQLAINPKFELCAMGEPGVLRLSGVAVEERNEDTAQRVKEKIGKYTGNNSLVVFRITEATARVLAPDGDVEEFKL